MYNFAGEGKCRAHLRKRSMTIRFRDTELENLNSQFESSFVDIWRVNKDNLCTAAPVPTPPPQDNDILVPYCITRLFMQSNGTQCKINFRIIIGGKEDFNPVSSEGSIIQTGSMD